MPETHDFGKSRFIQFLKNYRVEWGKRFVARGWTQEIEPPFRTSSPVIVRLPGHRALVYGKWSGNVDDEESALNKAIQGRVLSTDDFLEEKGWTPAAYETAEEAVEHLDFRTYYLE